jgi:hypothetical protein
LLLRTSTARPHRAIPAVRLAEPDRHVGRPARLGVPLPARADVALGAPQLLAPPVDRCASAEPHPSPRAGFGGSAGRPGRPSGLTTRRRGGHRLEGGPPAAAAPPTGSAPKPPPRSPASGRRC